jgi:hypothetical protein
MKRADDNIVEDREPGEWFDDLESSADAGSTDLIGTQAIDAITVEIYFAVLRGENSGNDIEQRRLTRAIGTNKRDDTILLDVE